MPKIKKAKLHIPTEQYGFAEVELENTTPGDIKKMYNDVKIEFQHEGEGHNLQEWAKVRRQYLNSGEISIDDYNKCNKLQRWFINEVKKHLKS